MPMVISDIYTESIYIPINVSSVDTGNDRAKK